MLAEEPAGAVIGGVIAILAAVATAYDTAIQPARQAERHHLGSSAFGALRSRYRDLARVPPPSAETARERFETLRAREDQVGSDAPNVEERARAAVESRVQDWLARRESDGADNVPPPEDLPANHRQR